MSYFAAAIVRGSDGWTATEIDLSGAADIEEVADLLREVDADAQVSLLFVESDETYLAILRLDDGEDLRVFGSDSVFAEESRLGALLIGDVEEPAIDLDSVAGGVDGHRGEAGEDEEEVGAVEADIKPVGDPDLLVDLGLPAHRLLELCARDGMLPSDVTAEVCQTIGCGDEMEELREG
ncbi:tRNA adenosine deaminase-associated protein [Planosporangium flavigriseum]|uniref:tRNA adenosine deaminase-associated protein n=1 Tax=Planosporangium flavigriseum TaxID=373681 RepID=UPI00143880D3|nr:tRNA adenosine deaminase-associated protein [Planosporangium flavigriseum]NJC66816.1 tRNA adenosine deaminase-associated protein [Planosporangium flavigriseum]